MDGALHIALQLEVWHKDSERLQLALPKLIADNKKLRDITQQSNQASGQGQNSPYDAAQEADDQRRLDAEQSRLVESLQKTIDVIEAMKLHVHTDTPRPKSYSGGKSQQQRKQRAVSYTHLTLPTNREV